MSPLINETEYTAWKNRYGFKLLTEAAAQAGVTFEDERIRGAYQDALNQGWDRAHNPGVLEDKIKALEAIINQLGAPTHQPLMSDEEIRAHQPHPGPVGGIGSPPKEAAE